MTRAVASGIAFAVLALIGVVFVVSRYSPKQAAKPTPVPVSESSLVAPVAANNTIILSNNTFSTPVITIKKGDTVSWNNNDATDHTITSDQPSVDAPMSQAFSLGQSFVFTFLKAGSYKYHCAFHSNMKGTVVVRE